MTITTLLALFRNSLKNSLTISWQVNPFSSPFFSTIFRFLITLCEKVSIFENGVFDFQVPFGKAAFFPGRLIHTNEFMVRFFC